jgi:Icc-related predicted phosphoesterase
MKITFISDTHNKHKQIEAKLSGGDVLVHSGDISSKGYIHEVVHFCRWFDSLDNYKHKIFIAGNHDFLFEKDPIEARSIIKSCKNITYLQDSELVIDGVKFYGSPWQPEFFNWAFNLPRGKKLAQIWSHIPNDTDVLITHGPPIYILDYTLRDMINVGCNDLYNRVIEVKPKIHCFGHIHEGYGYKEHEGVLFLNASTCNDRYEPNNNPINIELINNEIQFI